MPDESTQHDRLCGALADVLKGTTDVSTIVADRVSVGDPEAAEYPCVVIAKGVAYAGPPGQLRQYSVSVESRAESAEQLGTLLVAVQRRINGFRLGEVSQCVLSDTGPTEVIVGIHSRRDLFGVFAVGK